MQLPDEAISFNYQNLLLQPHPEEEWKPALEVASQHFLSPQRIKSIIPQMMQVKGQVATERDITEPPPHLRPLDSGFIDLPDKFLNDLRRTKDKSEITRIQAVTAQLRDQCDRIVILGIGGSYLGARALFESLRSHYHNELPFESRMGIPRIYFEGNNVDNDSLQDLLDLLKILV